MARRCFPVAKIGSSSLLGIVFHFLHFDILAVYDNFYLATSFCEGDSTPDGDLRVDELP